MKNDRIKHGLHPDWCALGDKCADPGRDPLHGGMTSTMFPLADDVRIDVELIRQDNLAPAVTVEGDKQICVRFTNMAACNPDGSPIVADTYLSHGDAMALAHTLQTYARRLEWRNANFPPNAIRGDGEGDRVSAWASARETTVDEIIDGFEQHKLEQIVNDDD